MQSFTDSEGETKLDPGEEACGPIFINFMKAFFEWVRVTSGIDYIMKAKEHSLVLSANSSMIAYTIPQADPVIEINNGINEEGVKDIIIPDIMDRSQNENQILFDPTNLSSIPILEKNSDKPSSYEKSRSSDKNARVEREIKEQGEGDKEEGIGFDSIKSKSSKSNKYIDKQPKRSNKIEEIKYQLGEESMDMPLKLHIEARNKSVSPLEDSKVLIPIINNHYEMITERISKNNSIVQMEDERNRKKDESNRSLNGQRNKSNPKSEGYLHKSHSINSQRDNSSLMIQNQRSSVLEGCSEEVEEKNDKEEREKETPEDIRIKETISVKEPGDLNFSEGMIYDSMNKVDDTIQNKEILIQDPESPDNKLGLPLESDYHNTQIDGDINSKHEFEEMNEIEVERIRHMKLDETEENEELIDQLPIQPLVCYNEIEHHSIKNLSSSYEDNTFVRYVNNHTEEMKGKNEMADFSKELETVQLKNDNNIFNFMREEDDVLEDNIQILETQPSKKDNIQLDNQTTIKQINKQNTNIIYRNIQSIKKKSEMVKSTSKSTSKNRNSALKTNTPINPTHDKLQTKIQSPLKHQISPTKNPASSKIIDKNTNSNKRSTTSSNNKVTTSSIPQKYRDIRQSSSKYSTPNKQTPTNHLVTNNPYSPQKDKNHKSKTAIQSGTVSHTTINKEKKKKQTTIKYIYNTNRQQAQPQPQAFSKTQLTMSTTVDRDKFLSMMDRINQETIQQLKKNIH